MTRSRYVAFAVALLALCACGGGKSGGDQNAPITISGSTALQPLVTAAAADYVGKHPEVKIDVQGGGSGKGLADVAAGTVTIGSSDVEAADSKLVDHEVAVNPFAIVAGPNTGVTRLTAAQVADIFNGKATNWKQLGGRDQAIVVFNRPKGSGTRHVFNATFLAGAEATNAGATLESSEQVAEKVKNTPGSTSYVALSYATKFNVPAVAVDGAAPSVANIRNKTYKFWAYEHMYTMPNPPADVEDFIATVKADDAAIDRLGFIAIKDVAELAATSTPAQ